MVVESEPERSDRVPCGEDVFGHLHDLIWVEEVELLGSQRLGGGRDLLSGRGDHRQTPRRDRGAALASYGPKVGGRLSNGLNGEFVVAVPSSDRARS